MESRPKTIFCDIDGTLVKQCTPVECADPSHKMELLEGVKDKFLEWDKKGYHIILTTARRESLREVTKKQLSEVGIYYDQLIMGIGAGERYLINDKKNNSEKDMAYAVSLKRNEGLKNIEI